MYDPRLSVPAAALQVVVNNAVQVAATGQLQTGVQFKIDDPTDIEPSVCGLIVSARVMHRGTLGAMRSSSHVCTQCFGRRNSHVHHPASA